MTSSAQRAAPQPDAPDVDRLLAAPAPHARRRAPRRRLRHRGYSARPTDGHRHAAGLLQLSYPGEPIEAHLDVCRANVAEDRSRPRLGRTPSVASSTSTSRAGGTDSSCRSTGAGPWLRRRRPPGDGASRSAPCRAIATSPPWPGRRTRIARRATPRLEPDPDRRALPPRAPCRRWARRIHGRPRTSGFCSTSRASSMREETHRPRHASGRP